MMNKNKISNLETLRYEKQRLKELSKQKEIELNATIDDIQSNAGMIVLRSFFPKKKGEKNSTFDFIHGIVGSSLDAIMEIVTDKEHRKEKIKNLAKDIVSKVIFNVVK